ncbi:MAG: metal ABC transporter substrate-binding protein [Oscillospiraceae bacterium]|nr:metal ABC transporter substrate-binding protein [Oscillospiraceae bacterium]
MKKTIAILLTLVLAVSLFALAGCGEQTTTTEPTETTETTETAELTPIVVGASSTPHAEILEQVKDALAEQGYDLQIVVYDDYVLPNTALEEGELDANYFQHTPYLVNFNEENGTHLASAALIHYEPFGLYGNGVASLEEVPEGATIIVPADGSNETRALFLLAQEGLITLPADATVEAGVTTLDIVDNGGYNITPVQADTVAPQLANAEEGTLAVVNGNYALAAGLNVNDALAVEDASGEAAQTYANIIAVREGEEASEKTQALVNALLTDAVKDYINGAYEGAVVPIF